ncbi:thioredoxin-like protein [Gorgonomyces haynaldii]|nr:thioredoxin-like protein [Gorgonomyces haynaldii]
MARVIVYYSSVAGNVKIKKEQTRVQDLLKAKGIEYELVDLAQDDKAKEYMKSKSGKTVIPQIFVDGEFKGE